MTLSTHVLDSTTGRPAVGVGVFLEQSDAAGWRRVHLGATGEDGRLQLGETAPGIYRLTFEVGTWFKHRGAETFYPEVGVTFEVTSADEHYHVPLLLSPFGYATYRGS
jgi:5-hydroxyisourate hydrolase